MSTIITSVLALAAFAFAVAVPASTPKVKSCCSDGAACCTTGAPCCE